MADIGKTRRLARMFDARSGRMLCLALDHGMQVGTIAGIEDPARLLDAFFRGVVQEAVDEGLCVEMRFERLDFFNSATITTLIQFVQEMSRNEARLVLVFDSKKRWQKLSFDVLRVFEKADGLLELRPMEA